MFSLILKVLSAVVLYRVVSKALAWRRNYQAAKASGFPVFLSPVYFADLWFLTLYPILVPILNLLPHNWTQPWLMFAQAWRIYELGYGPFEQLGTDTFLISSPNGNSLWSADAAIINQLFTQHKEVQVPVHLVKFFEVWGQSVSTSTSLDWKVHRRVVVSGFSVETNPKVWEDTVYETKKMLGEWKQHNNVVTVMRDWTCRLSLHVLLCSFFDRKVSWDLDEEMARCARTGHRMTLETAINTVLNHIGLLYITPKILLKYTPIEKFQKSHLAREECLQYMKEMRAEVVANKDEVSKKKYHNLLESIVMSGLPSADSSEPLLPEVSVLNNLFDVTFAGFETTGNTIGFMMLLLAVHPEHQRKLQAQLDKELPQNVSRADAGQVSATLQKGYLGAIMKETLRIYSVIPYLFRWTVEPTTLTDSFGQKHVLGASTLCMSSFVGSYRNPKVWKPVPHSPEYRELLHNSPVLDFNPERWLSSENTGTAEVVDTPNYFTFGAGPRKCPGKGMSYTEMAAAMATVFSKYSLELVVEPEIVRECGGDKQLAWQKVQEKAIRLMHDDIDTYLTIRLFKELPVRLVERQ